MLRVVILLSLLALPLSAAMVQNDLPTPLFDGRATDSAFVDVGSGAATCTPTNVTFVEDPASSGLYAAEFDGGGTDSIINCGTGLDGLHSSGTRTIYVKVDTIGETAGHIYTKQTAATTRSWVLNLAPDTNGDCTGGATGECFNFFNTDTGDEARNHMSPEGSAGTGSGNYVHITFVLVCTSTTTESCDGTKAYLNGFEVTVDHGTGTGTIRTADTGDGFYIGNRPAGDREFDGRIKRTVVFAEALNKFQAEATYYRTLNLDTPDVPPDPVEATECDTLMTSYLAAAGLSSDPFERTTGQFQSGDGCSVMKGVPTR